MMLDAWAVGVLAGAPRVRLLGPGWADIAAALAHQGSVVTLDTPPPAHPVPDGVQQVTEDDTAVHPIVGVALGGGGALQRALRASDGPVLTRLDIVGGGELAGLARAWPLTLRDDVWGETTWLAVWDPTDEPNWDLASRLIEVLHNGTVGLASVADAAVDARERAARSAATASRDQAAAEARATATAALAERWVSSQEVALTSLSAALAAPTAPQVPPPADPAGLLDRLRSRRPPPSSPAPAPSASTPRAITAPGWRVAVVAGPAADWLGGWVDATVLVPAEGVAGALVESVGGHLDVLVIGPVDPTERAEVIALAREARSVGAAVIGVAVGGAPWARFEDLCDLVVTDDPATAGPRVLAAAAPIDPLVLNPTVGFRSAATGVVTVVTDDAADLTAVCSAVAATGVQPDLVGAGTDVALPTETLAWVARLRNVRGVLDVAAAHATAATHARTLVALAASGIPVVVTDLPDTVRDLLGPVLAGTLTTASVTNLDDPSTRERLSVRQRRAALWAHTVEARWRRLGHALDLPVPPRTTVSAVMMTNRPAHLRHCADQLARQTHRPLQVVLGLHGPAFARRQVEEFRDRVGLDVTVVPIDGHRTLGEGLTLACHAADGAVVTKWDDDDHYGPDHVVDLVQALEYSQATIVGKGSEFVHLGPLDVTIRRFAGNAESGSRSLAGGTLALRRDDLATAGGWRRVPRAVDQCLLDDVVRAGGRVHRTHGFGFVLARRADGHTWSVDVDYFLAQSQAQWRGLARDAAGLDDRVIPAPMTGVAEPPWA